MLRRVGAGGEGYRLQVLKAFLHTSVGHPDEWVKGSACVGVEREVRRWGGKGGGEDARVEELKAVLYSIVGHFAGWIRGIGGACGAGRRALRQARAAGGAG